MGPVLRREPFGTSPAGAVERIVLEHGDVSLAVLTLGAVVQSLRVPDRDGVPGEVVLGYPDLAGYAADRAFLGAVVGRYANRIAGGRFTLDGREHVVPANDGPNALHGGPDGFHRRRWSPRPFRTADAVGIELCLTSPAGDMGFPGRLEACVTYTLWPDEVRVDLRAVANAPTVVNLTQHSYFNLAGAGTVHDHRLRLDAERYLPVDGTGIPLGDPAPVDGTVFDFRRDKPVGRDRRGVFDHSWLLEGHGTDVVAARLSDPVSGRVLEVGTDAPAVQLYTGSALGGASGHPALAGLCLETQWLPDSPNHPAYPSTVLRPDEEWRSSTRWRFGVDG